MKLFFSESKIQSFISSMTTADCDGSHQQVMSNNNVPNNHIVLYGYIYNYVLDANTSDMPIYKNNFTHLLYENLTTQNEGNCYAVGTRNLPI